MNFLLKLLTVIIFICASVQAHKFQKTLGHLKPTAHKDVQHQAVLDLIRRIVPQRAEEFNVKIDTQLDSDGRDAFTIKKEDKVVKITGTTGVAAATGFNYYLKYYLFWQIEWQGSNMNVTQEFPNVDIKITLNDKFRYYQNVCTTSYSFVWWNWAQWEKHIDWMALNSFNFVLAFNGQEAIWKRVYQKFNLTEDDINEHFTGPAFLSWLRMGNIRGFAGPLSDSWHERSLILQKQILERMRSFGMIPILPAFAGHLPRAFKRLYPDANIVQLEAWNGFNDTYSGISFVDPTDRLFSEVGKAFLEEQISEYGTDHVYNCDSFNENTPPTTDLQYLANVSQRIFQTITDVDPQGIWVMQGWLFTFDFWTNERVQALVTAVPQGKMIILDLQSEEQPQYNRLEQYFGQPYIWCMLHNFGGTLGNSGRITVINTEPIKARNAENSTMIGIGLVPEGINQNYVIYDFMIENAWRNESEDIGKWIEKYVKRRYPIINEQLVTGWKNWINTFYDLTTERFTGPYALTSTPSWEISTANWDNNSVYYDVYKDIMGGIIIISMQTNWTECFACSYDSVDFVRQLFQIQIDGIYRDMLDAFNGKLERKFRALGLRFQLMVRSLDDLCKTDKNFLLGVWLEEAKSCANNSEEMKLFEYNARNQITLWGPKGELTNYASKQWSGLIEDVYLARWKLFIHYCLDVLQKHSEFNQSYIRDVMFHEIEEPFTFGNKTYPTEPQFRSVVEYVKNIFDSLHL